MRKREIRFEGDLAFVTLTAGYVSVIDASDAPLVSGRNWYAMKSFKRDGALSVVYAAGRNGKTPDTIHRAIMGAPIGMFVDHIDGDGLNNTRSNLRLCTNAENMCNTGLRIDNTSGAKGVQWDKRRGKWKAYVKCEGIRKNFGSFADFDAAVAAAEAGRMRLHGAFARQA